MSLIIEKIEKIPNLYYIGPANIKQVKAAQKELDIYFPEEYIDVIRKYGVISFYGTEWTGLNVDGDLNVVAVTKKERELDSSFPSDCFVLENQGIEGILIICNQEGEVFSLQYSKVKKIYDSISDYLDECICRAR